MHARLATALALLVSGCSFSPDRTDPTSTGDDQPAPDADPTVPAVVHRDCMDALANGVTNDGVVMIDPDGDGGNAPFEAYCDQTSAGGGWTLVWSYGFTDYASFNNADNAVTPQPTWTPVGNAPTSTTVPLAPGMPGALDFARWVDLGDKLLVDSNINHVVSCAPAGPAGGSLPSLRMGPVNCTVVRVVASLCTTNVPTQLAVLQGAIGLLGPDTYYYWDGRTTAIGGNWPTHDPCGTNQQNHKPGVTSPYGAVFLRR